MSAARAWSDAVAAIELVRRGGLSLTVRARSGPVRDRLLARLGADALRLTADSDAAMLAPGVDLLASLAAGTRIERTDLGTRARGRVVIVAGAERLGGPLCALLAELADAQRVGLVLLDEGDDDMRVPAMLAERIAMGVDLDAVSIRDTDAVPDPPGAPVGSDPVAALCEAAQALGIGSARVPLHALAVLRALAAGRQPCAEDHARVARLVLGPRATRLPDDPPAPAPQDGPEDRGDAEDGGGEDADRDLLVAAARAAIPFALIDPKGTRGGGAGSADARRGAGARGRGGRVRTGLPTRGSRLDLAATLIAAAPLQRLRGRLPGARLAILREDIRIRRPLPVQRATTVFAVDASGSSALSRLGEVKGAIERLLGESYVRRDEVALVAFRGAGAQTLLPPTRSLARARRELSALPGGGATPLAAGIVAGLEQAVRSRHAGRAPLLVVLTDGGANVARDGVQGRTAARADAEAAGRLVAASGIAALVIDSSPRGDAGLRTLAATMHARYFALPRLDDRSLGAIVAAAR